jgi:osmotically-inducible protein OsmY
MARLHRYWALAGALALPLGLPLALGGCDGGLVIGGLALAASGGYVAAQERGVDGTATDAAIKLNIAKAFSSTDPRLQIGVTTSVYQGRVLLTGRVPTPEMKAAAAQIAGRTQNVRAVYDEVELAPAEGVWDNAQDAWITARVRSEMVVDPAIRSINYTIDTENGSVFLIGSARSQDELDRATRIARTVPGVKRVVSYVELRSGAPATAAAIPPPAAAVPMPGQPAAAPRAPIQVEKL